MPPFRLAALLLGASLSVSAHAQTEIAPGVSLPSTASVAAVQNIAGQPHVTPVHSSDIKSNSHAGSNFARSMVYAGPHKTIELEGTKAEIAMGTRTPDLYVDLGNKDRDITRSRITLIRLEPTSTTRVAADFSANVFGGSHKRNVEVVEATKTDVAGSNWVKLTPAAPLEPGEYGVVLLPKDKDLFPDRVYDFSVPETAK